MTITDDRTARIERAVHAALPIPGWMTPEELRWLAETAAHLPRGAILIEIGSWCGRSTTALALAMPDDAKLIAVDTWQGSPEDLGRSPDGRLPTKGTRQLTATALWWKFQANLYDQITQNRVVPLRMTSEQAQRLFRDGIADLVFIDGSHTEAAVRQDIWWWQSKVAPGCLLAGHDFYPDGAVCPGVKAAVEALIEPVEFPAGSIWCWRRRGER